VSRLQLALNVSNLEEAVGFYSKFSRPSDENTSRLCNFAMLNTAQVGALRNPVCRAR